MAVETLLARCNGRLHLRVDPTACRCDNGSSSLYCGNGSNLWQTSDTGRPRLLDDGKHLKRRHESVAGGRIVRQDNMPGLFAAEIISILSHMFEHVAVAKGVRASESPRPSRILFKAEIRHHGSDYASGRDSLPSSFQLSAIAAISWSPSTTLPRLVGDKDAVGVPVERDADIGPHFPDLAA